MELVAFIVSIITAASTVVVPIVTAVINNRHSSKMKRIEMFAEKRIDTVNRYVSDVGRYLTGQKYDDEGEMGASLCSVYLYVPKELWADLDLLYEKIRTGEIDEAQKLFPEAAKKLADSVANPK